VLEVHDLHIWEITSGSPTLSAHVIIEAEQDYRATRGDLAKWLAREHGVVHSTLQIDHAPLDRSGIAEPSTREHCQDPHGPIHRSPDTEPEDSV
jgi:cobalt-zinc-cadmium efflux system protein